MEHRVSRPDLESLLGPIEERTADPRGGIFGPDSVTWKINRESAVFLGAGRAALLQLAHPWVAAALREHSTVLGDPIARFHNTFRIVFTMIFGSASQALAAARHLHTVHTSIRGNLTDSVAGWTKGSPYEANEIAALRWVYATLIESALLAYQFVLPLTGEEREQYYRESRTMAALFGIPVSALPPDWTAFCAYNQAMPASPELGVSDSARSMAHDILRGAGSTIHPPQWYRALTAEWMPPRFREEFALGFSVSDRRAASRAGRWLPALYRALPNAVRWVGPCHEAEARLGHRGAGVLARWSNRFWIGQPLMPFAEEFRCGNRL